MPEWTITTEENGLSLLEIMQRRVPGAPAGYLRQLIRKDKVRVSEKEATPETSLQGGDRLWVADTQRLNELISRPAPPAVEILFENQYILIAYKPSGLAVHKGLGHEQDNLVDRIGLMLKNRKVPYEAKPIHRLDVETSGPVLFGKGRKAASSLGKLFMANQAQKKYLALCAGELPDNGLLNSTVPAKGKIKEAQTSFRRLFFYEGLSLVELELHSGRTHQIRRQLADEGHPLAGDRRYGGPAIPHLTRVFLHCHHLSLPDPFGGPDIHVRCPLPADLRTILLEQRFPEFDEPLDLVQPTIPPGPHGQAT